MTKYCLRSTVGFKSKGLDLDAVGREIEELSTTGDLTPARVVEKAKNPDTALHVAFEWNLSKAAYENWLNSARSLIRAICIKVEQNQQSMPIYYRVTEDDKSSYKPIGVVVKNVNFYNSALEQLQGELNSARRSVSALEDAARANKSKQQAAKAARVRKSLEATIKAAKDERPT